MNTEQTPLSQQVESIRNKIASIRSELFDMRMKKGAHTDQVDCVEGLLTCGLVTLASTSKEMLAFEIKQTDITRGPSIKFNGRGIGLDVIHKCFCCDATTRTEGDDFTYMHNIAGFVTKDDGEAITGWFSKGGTRLDFRPSEPDWVQFKIGACDRHLPNLKMLSRLAGQQDRMREMDVKEAMEFVPETDTCDTEP
jgi:hypothetical protein